MTFQRLYKIIEANNIPHNVKLLSDSGWECDPTDMNGIFYNEKENIIIFTQDIQSPYINQYYGSKEEWKCLCGEWYN